MVSTVNPVRLASWPILMGMTGSLVSTLNNAKVTIGFDRAIFKMTPLDIDGFRVLDPKAARGLMMVSLQEETSCTIVLKAWTAPVALERLKLRWRACPGCLIFS